MEGLEFEPEEVPLEGPVEDFPETSSDGEYKNTILFLYILVLVPFLRLIFVIHITLNYMPMQDVTT